MLLELNQRNNKMNAKFRIMFLRDKKKQPVGCVAIGLTRSNKSVKYQVSVLNPIDKFDRSLSRQIALGRLLENAFTAELSGALDMHEISRSVMTHLAGNRDVPQRAQRAAQLWLKS
jgi:hypothetical protein